MQKNTKQKLFDDSLKAIWKYPNLYKILYDLTLACLWGHPSNTIFSPYPQIPPECTLCAPVLAICPKLLDATSFLSFTRASVHARPSVDAFHSLFPFVSMWLSLTYTSPHHPSRFSLQPAQARLPWPILPGPSSEASWIPGPSPSIWIVILCSLPTDRKLPVGRNCCLSCYFQCLTQGLGVVDCYSLRNEWMNE